jgi:hypothetical protein
MRRIAIGVLVLGLAASIGSGQVSYGVATPGSGSWVPALLAPQPWMGNLGFGLQVVRGLGGATALLGLSTAPASFALGTTQILISVAPQDLFLLETLTLSGPALTPGAGTAYYPLPLALAVDPLLAGFDVYAQAVVLDTLQGTPSASRGLWLELSMPPAVFVGTSVAGNTDPHYFVDPVNLTLLANQGISFTDNVTGAAFTNGGRDLFVSRSLGNAVVHADCSTFPATWSSFYVSAGNGCYGIGIDHVFKLVYTLTNPGTGMVELVALDADPANPTYGQPLSSTVGLTGGTNFVERWALSPDGRLAAILTVFNNLLILVDTDPTSSTWMQVLGSTPVPTPPTSPFNLATQAAFTPEGDVILILIQTLGSAPGEIARYLVSAQAFLDHDLGAPGIQNIGPASVPPAGLGSAPVGIAVPASQAFAVVSGFGGPGWAGRLDFDPANPFLWQWTTWTPGPSLQGAYACDVAADATTAAIGTFPNSQLVVVDPANGSLLGTVGLPAASNVYTVVYR